MENPNSTPNGRVQDEECGNCGTKKAWVLHTVRYRANLRRLCTSCVLRLHPSSFCPLCFLSHPDQNALVSCSKCPSLSHPDCLPPDVSGPSNGGKHASKNNGLKAKE